jgi:hypothetical protein
LAEAGLGNIERAAELLDQESAARAEVTGPLTRGALSHTRACVALLARDFAACERHAQEMERNYLATGIPSLVGFCQSFARERRRAQRPAGATRLSDQPLSDISSGIFDGRAFERELSQTQGDLRTHAERGLHLLTHSLGVADGGLFVMRDEQAFLVAQLGESELPSTLKNWVRGRLLQGQQDDITHTESAFAESGADPDVWVADARRYRLFPLSVPLDGRVTTVGAVVFAEQAGIRHYVARELLDVFAQRVLYDLESSRADALTLAEGEEPDR